MLIVISCYPLPTISWSLIDSNWMGITQRLVRFRRVDQRTPGNPDETKSARRAAALYACSLLLDPIIRGLYHCIGERNC